MQIQNPEHPIGIFDSGMGGLTVAKAITELLPYENIVYFGDTAHTPWGDKSLTTVQNYALKICDVLLEHRCKYIVIACHTASAIAARAVTEYVGNKAYVVNVIDPVINHIHQHHANKKIGLIGTKQTVRSNTYKDRLEILDRNIEFSALATPLLVPLIEEGFKDSAIAEMVVKEYLSQPQLSNIHALVLGCTHYPLIKKYIQGFYQNTVELIDASEVTAKMLKQELLLNNLLNQAQLAVSDISNPSVNTIKEPKRLFYASDNSDFFAHTTQLFFQSSIELNPYSF